MLRQRGSVRRVVAGFRFATFALPFAIGSAGCGGGAALLHPAHALPTSAVRMGAGVQGNFVLGDADQRIEAARAAIASDSAIEASEQQSYAEGAIAHVLFAPGLAPWVGARAGVGHDTEAGLTYTGRSARIDARHAFEGKELALSAGLGASALLSRRGSSPDNDPTARDQAVPGIDTSGLSGWGFDAPVIAGWRSSAELIQVWFGLRGGHERVMGDVLLRIEPSATTEETAELDVSRWYGGALCGVMVAIDPLWVAIELDASIGRGQGTLARPIAGGKSDVELTGVSLSPAGAIGGTF
jgi:hypothetical protein